MPTVHLVALAVPAHGVGSRQDLPLPFTALVIGAVVALVASFLALALLWREPRLPDDAGWALPGGVQVVLGSRWLRRAAMLAVLLVTALVLLALVAGQDDARNPVPYVVYVWLWVGMPVLSMLLGPVWVTLNPFRLLHRAVRRVARISPDFTLAESRLDYWPAASLLLAFTWLELIADNRTTLPVLRVALGLFTVVSVIAPLAVGSRWFAEGDPFEVLSRLYGRLSPIGRRPDGRLVLRSPVHGPGLQPPARGLLAAVAVMLGGTAYDSLSANLRYTSWVQSSGAPTFLRTVTLIAVCALVGLALQAAAALAAAVARVPVRGMAAQLAPSVIPIAAGYLVAHYWSLLVFQGQNTLRLLSDPMGVGANVLGTGGLVPNQALIAPTLVAVVQAGSIVLGHVLGVVVAHERAIRLFPRRQAIPGQVPLMVLMVGYTVGGLSLLFAG